MTFIRKVVLSAAVVGAVSFAAPAAMAQISGAGATFPYPIYAKWAEAFKAKTGVSVNYQSIGSGGGIKQIQAKTVDFGATDSPLKQEELEKSGLVQFPAVMGGIVPVINIKGIDTRQLKLDGKTLASIYMGDVKKWNDPAITKLNPDLKLPDQAIAPVYRSDGSGTTFLFTDYLSKVSADFKTKIGSNTAVQWPSGLGGKGNEGVAALATRTDGAIGYVEYAYAKQNKMPYALMENAAGKFVAPEISSFQAAAANADWAGTPGYAVILTNAAGEKSWPITGATFILVHKAPEKPDNVKQVLKFFEWAYENGDKMAEELDYVPMPDAVVKLVEGSWKSIKSADGKPLY